MRALIIAAALASSSAFALSIDIIETSSIEESFFSSSKLVKLESPEVHMIDGHQVICGERYHGPRNGGLDLRRGQTAIFNRGEIVVSCLD